MTTAANLIDEAIDLLYGSTRQSLNTLSGSHAAATTTWTFNYDLTTSGIGPGSLLSCEQELVFVTAVNLAAKTATVIRAQRGSTAPTAHADASVVSVNPKFSRYSIFRQLNHDLNDLSGQGLFKVVAVDLTYNAAIEGYDITGATDIIQVLEVVRDTPGPDNAWPVIPPSKWKLRRTSETSDFTSGFGLVIYAGVDPGRTVRVRYASSLGQLTDETTTTASVGLPDSATDLPPLGAAMALMIPREGIRNQFEGQPDSRRPSEVPPGALLGSARQWAAWRAQRIQTEIGNLKQDWPMVKR